MPFEKTPVQEDNNCDMEDDEVYIDTSLEKINKANVCLLWRFP